MKITWSNPEEVKERNKEYMKEYRQRPEVKERNKFHSFSWDDMAELIRIYDTVDISLLPERQQKVFRSAGEKGVIRLEGNLASKTALTHALDGFVR